VAGKLDARSRQHEQSLLAGVKLATCWRFGAAGFKPYYQACFQAASSSSRPFCFVPLQAMHEDPRLAVVMAFALPFLALSFGTSPKQADMDAGKPT
jgi:hypothetical protein